jgi:hypothetical protein
MSSAKVAELEGKSDSQEAFWSYFFPLGKLEAGWEQFDFIFFDEGRIQVNTVRMRKRSKEEHQAYLRETGQL